MLATTGVVGLGVMGGSLLLNIAEKTGEMVCGFDLSGEKAELAAARGKAEGLKVQCYSDLGAFVGSMEPPRKIVILVPAGGPVDACLASLGPLLSAGDVIMDGGNEWFENTERREREMAEKYSVHYFGCGVSGGAEGARHGPALMVGGPPAAFALLKPTLTKIAAQHPAPCLVYCGPGGAGNYVKMVHNGIEYGDMELIGEAYGLLRARGMTNVQAAALFERWNRDDSLLQSFLIEITAKILMKDNGDLVDQVLDQTGSKGTGKWTVQEAANKGVPMPTVSAALEARYTSAQRQTRLKASAALAAVPTTTETIENNDAFVTDLEAALVCSKICSYAQGLALIEAAKEEYKWTDLRIADVLRCWRGGCIIRAKLLVDFAAALGDDTSLDNLILHPTIAKIITDRVPQWRRLAAAAITSGNVPVPALTASLAYFDALRSSRLNSAALIQAQRDCFGGHTYKRLDDPTGPSHTSNWLS